MNGVERNGIHPALLELMGDEDTPATLLDDDFDVSALRAEFLETMQMLGGEPPDICHIENHSIKNDGNSISIRVYAPRENREPDAPIIAFFHGGGFMQGSLDSHDGICRALANESGAVVATIDYRKSPENIYPTGHMDCARLIDWIRQNAGELNIDIETLCLAGDSAGATIAAGLIASGKVEGIAFQMLFYPSTDHVQSSTESHRLFGQGFWLDNVSFYVRKYMPEASMRRETMASPARAESLADMPPAYICTAGFDPLRDEGRAYAQRLDRESGGVDYENYPGMLHGFLNCLAIVDQANTCLKNAARSYNKVLENR